MTQEVRDRINYYLTKTKSWPHVRNLASDFNITTERAKELLDEYRSEKKGPILAPSPAEPVKQTITRVTKDYFDKISKKPEVKIDSHEKLVQHGGVSLAIQIISGLIFLACTVRGFIVIAEINSVIGWQGYLNAVIFQGGSAILPVVGIVYFSNVSKKEWHNVLMGLFMLTGGLGSMTYEVYASSQVFHTTNMKQEISVQKSLTDTKDAILESIQENINSENSNIEVINSNISKRRAELAGLISKNSSKIEVDRAQSRVSSWLVDLTDAQNRLSDLSEKKTQRLVLLEERGGKNSSLVNVADSKVQGIVEIIVTLIPSIFMVVFTPIFFSIMLFGIKIGGKK